MKLHKTITLKKLLTEWGHNFFYRHLEKKASFYVVIEKREDFEYFIAFNNNLLEAFSCFTPDRKPEEEPQESFDILDPEILENFLEFIEEQWTYNASEMLATTVNCRYINKRFGKDASTNIGWSVDQDFDGSGAICSKVYGHGVVTTEWTPQFPDMKIRTNTYFEPF